MGIKNLSKVIKTYAPDAIKDVKAKDYKNTILAFDTSMTIHQCVIAMKGNHVDLSNSNGKSTVHIYGIINKIIPLLQNNITPVFVFDGKPPEIKSCTIDKRRKIKKDAIDKMNKEGISQEEKDKLLKRTITVSFEEMAEVKEIIKLMGLYTVSAPMEADPQCAYLVDKKICKATVTEDMDLLTFGSKLLIRNFTLSKSSKKKPQEYNLKKILKDMQFTMKQFIDLCILLGCDYCETINKVGIKRAVSLIEEFKTIEKIIDNTNYKLPYNNNRDEYLKNVKLARKEFTKPKIKKITELKKRKINYTKLKNKLFTDYEISDKKINTLVKVLINYHKNNN